MRSGKHSVYLAKMAAMVAADPILHLAWVLIADLLDVESQRGVAEKTADETFQREIAQ